MVLVNQAGEIVAPRSSSGEAFGYLRDELIQQP